MFQRSWVWITMLYTGWTWHIFTLICCKNCVVCLKRPTINEKEAGVGQFKNNWCQFYYRPGLPHSYLRLLNIPLIPKCLLPRSVQFWMVLKPAILNIPSSFREQCHMRGTQRERERERERERRKLKKIWLNLRDWNMQREIERRRLHLEHKFNLPSEFDFKILPMWHFSSRKKNLNFILRALNWESERIG